MHSVNICPQQRATHMESLCNLYSPLTHKAVVLLQFEDLADVFDAARREFLIVFTHLICGVREHKVPAFTSIGTKITAVWALIMLKQKLTWTVYVQTETAGGNKFD